MLSLFYEKLFFLFLEVEFELALYPLSNSLAPGPILTY
jgi:hypothetical protein